MVPCPAFGEEIHDLVWDRLQALEQDDFVGKYFDGGAYPRWYYSDEELSVEEMKVRNRILTVRIKHIFTLKKK